MKSRNIKKMHHKHDRTEFFRSIGIEEETFKHGYLKSLSVSRTGTTTFEPYNGTGKECLIVSIRAAAFFASPFSKIIFARTLFSQTFF